LLTLGLAACLYAGPAAAQWVHFDPPKSVINGYTARVAMGGGDVAMVSCTAGILGYTAIQVLEGVILTSGNLGQLYDSGYYPTIGMNNLKVIVEAHKGYWDNTLWYHVGKMYGTYTDIIGGYTPKLVLGSSRYFDHNGTEPTVAVNDSNIVVEAHRQ